MRPSMRLEPRRRDVMGIREARISESIARDHFADEAPGIPSDAQVAENFAFQNEWPRRAPESLASGTGFGPRVGPFERERHQTRAREAEMKLGLGPAGDRFRPCSYRILWKPDAMDRLREDPYPEVAPQERRGAPNEAFPARSVQDRARYTNRRCSVRTRGKSPALGLARDPLLRLHAFRAS